MKTTISRLTEAREQVAEMAHVLEASGNPGSAETMRHVAEDIKKAIKEIREEHGIDV